jgi:uncharacterized protein YjdB
MAYKFILAEKPIQMSPKQEYIDYLQRTMDEQFYNASDWFTIEEETSFASGEYQNVDVRVNSVVNIQTGERVGDDFKRLLFKTIGHPVSLGRMYRFSDNYWITVNVEEIKDSTTARVTVRRCNNVMRWIDDNGGYHEAPCSINALIKENRDYSTAGSAMVVPSGMIDVLVQMTPYTRKLQPNKRFLFGNMDNWTAYRIEGGGIRNFDNLRTFDNLSVGLMMFNMATDYVNVEIDDVTNGIANAQNIVYTLTLNQASISGSSGQTVQLEAIVELNNQVVSRQVAWSSSNPNVATVNTSGLVTFLSTGIATITCSLLNNADVNDTASVTVVSSPVDNYQVLFIPSANYVLEDEERTWSVYLYKNGVQQADTFVFTLDANTVPSANYIYTVTGGNSFKIQNFGMFLTDTLNVTATSGAHSRDINISLRGAW